MRRRAQVRFGVRSQPSERLRSRRASTQRLSEADGENKRLHDALNSFSAKLVELEASVTQRSREVAVYVDSIEKQLPSLHQPHVASNEATVASIARQLHGLRQLVNPQQRVRQMRCRSSFSAACSFLVGLQSPRKAFAPKCAYRSLSISPCFEPHDGLCFFQPLGCISRHPSPPWMSARRPPLLCTQAAPSDAQLQRLPVAPPAKALRSESLARLASAARTAGKGSAGGSPARAPRKAAAKARTTGLPRAKRAASPSGLSRRCSTLNSPAGGWSVVLWAAVLALVATRLWLRASPSRTSRSRDNTVRAAGLV